MTILGIGLIICGLTLVCASAVFPWIVGPRNLPLKKVFEERLERLGHYGVRRDAARFGRRQIGADRPRPKDRERRDHSTHMIMVRRPMRFTSGPHA